MAKDIIHNAVKNALIKDGWTITAFIVRRRNLNLLVVNIYREEVVKWIS